MLIHLMLEGPFLCKRISIRAEKDSVAVRSLQ